VLVRCQLITTKHTDNMPVGFRDRAHEFESYVWLYWVNVGGLGDESVKLNFKYGFFSDGELYFN